MKHVAVCTVVLALIAGPAWAQDPPLPPPGISNVDSAKVNQAITKGVNYLKNQIAANVNMECVVGEVHLRLEEFVLYTLVHADVPESDPVVVRLFDSMAQRPMTRTYEVVMQAMILEDMNRVKYQPRIAQCAQWLVDNQCSSGQWSYGEPTASVGTLIPLEGPPTRSTDKPKKKMAVAPRKNGPGTGDNSNSQYAALGLRACADAGIAFPPGVIQAAQKWWRSAAHDDDKKDVYGGKGWCYGPKNGCPWATSSTDGKNNCHSYGGMTAGAVASLAIYDYMMGNKWQKDPTIMAGLKWLDRNWSVTDHPGIPEFEGCTKDWMQYYYLYAIERVGTLYGTDKIGKHDWYFEGANQLFATQGADGSWLSKQPAFGGANNVWDTCFAILFLRRATKPLKDVATGGGKTK